MINFKRPSQQWAANEHLDRKLGRRGFVPTRVGIIGEDAEGVVAANGGGTAVPATPGSSGEGVGLMSRILGGYFGTRRSHNNKDVVSTRARGATNGDRIREHLRHQMEAEVRTRQSNAAVVQTRPKFERRLSGENLRGSVIRRNAQDLLARFDRRNGDAGRAEEREGGDESRESGRRLDHHRSDTFLMGYPSDNDDSDEEDDDLCDHHQSCAGLFFAGRHERRNSHDSMSLEDIFEEGDDDDDEPRLLPPANNPATMSLPATLFARSEAGMIARAPFGLDEPDSCDDGSYDDDGSFTEENYMASMPCMDFREFERGDATRSGWRPWVDGDDDSLSMGDGSIHGYDGEKYLSCSLPSWPNDAPARYYERARAA